MWLIKTYEQEDLSAIDQTKMSLCCSIITSVLMLASAQTGHKHTTSLHSNNSQLKLSSSLLCEIQHVTGSAWHRHS